MAPPLGGQEPGSAIVRVKIGVLTGMPGPVVTRADPSPEDFRAMVPMRDKAMVAAVNVSKADFDGTKFGPSMVALLYVRQCVRRLCSSASRLREPTDRPCYRLLVVCV